MAAASRFKYLCRLVVKHRQITVPNLVVQLIPHLSRFPAFVSAMAQFHNRPAGHPSNMPFEHQPSRMLRSALHQSAFIPMVPASPTTEPVEVFPATNPPACGNCSATSHVVIVQGKPLALDFSALFSRGTFSESILFHAGRFGRMRLFPQIQSEFSAFWKFQRSRVQVRQNQSGRACTRSPRATKPKCKDIGSSCRPVSCAKSSKSLLASRCENTPLPRGKSSARQNCNVLAPKLNVEARV